METAGDEPTAVTMTGFCDDAAIPTWAKAYAAAGVADGIIQGVSTAEGVAFQGDEPITFNEAATAVSYTHLGAVRVSDFPGDLLPVVAVDPHRECLDTFFSCQIAPSSMK